MKKYVIAGLAGIGLMMASASFAQQVKNADQRFSFKGKRTTFKERDVDNIEVVVSSADSEGRISVIESDWLPEFQVEPHYHKRHAETFYIISGNVEWTIGGETHVMGPGDAVHIPPNTVHSVKVVGGKKMHSLMIAEPGGYEEDSVYASSFTPEQRKDPKIIAKLDKEIDYNPVARDPGHVPPQRKTGEYFSFTGKRTPYPGGDVEKGEIVVSANDSQGSLSLVESYWLPSFSAPLHYHKTHSETFYILSGHVEWTIGGETHVMGPGDAVHIRPNTVHGVKVVGGEKMHSLWFDQPAGMEEDPNAEANLTPEERNDPKRMEQMLLRDDFHPADAK